MCILDFKCSRKYDNKISLDIIVHIQLLSVATHKVIIQSPAVVFFYDTEFKILADLKQLHTNKSVKKYVLNKT